MIIRMLDNMTVYMKVDSVIRSYTYSGYFVTGKDLLSGSIVEIFVQYSALTPLKDGTYKFKRNLFSGGYVTNLLEYDELAWSPFVRALYNSRKEILVTLLTLIVIAIPFI